MSSPDSFEDYNGENGSSFGDPKKKKGPAPRQQEGKSSKFEPQSLRYKYRHELILMPHFFSLFHAPSRDNPSWTIVISSSELCLVCGDRASGYHYNALTCEGCKGKLNEPHFVLVTRVMATHTRERVTHSFVDNFHSFTHSCLPFCSFFHFNLFPIETIMMNDE